MGLFTKNHWSILAGDGMVAPTNYYRQISFFLSQLKLTITGVSCHGFSARIRNSI
jgi:hypothetical protein